MKKRRREPESKDLGNPLGLSNEPIARSPEDHLPGSTDPSNRRSRARALGEDGIEQPSSGLGDIPDEHDGAAGIDMGSGGHGTNISSRRR